MTSEHHHPRRDAIDMPLRAFAALAAIAFLVFAFSTLLDGVGFAIVLHPVTWLARFDHAAASSLLSDASTLMAGLLALAITVSAIVVQLASTRYNHRITMLFLREPVNIGVWALFLVTTLQCLWVAMSRNTGEVARVPGAAFGITLALVTLCLLTLLPYFFFVFRFLRPPSIIEKIADTAYRLIVRAEHAPPNAVRHGVQDAIDELQDVARSARELSDRSIAMACVNALKDLVIDYQDVRPRLPEAWFAITDSVAADADFVSLAHVVIEDIERQRTWLEVKVLQQYHSLMAHCVPDAREVANLIAINTGRIGIELGAGNAALLELCIRFFNNYLRTAMNAADNRTAYFVMNQYRILAESLMQRGLDASVIEVGEHFRWYGQQAHAKGMPFLLQTAADDLTSLVEASLAHDGDALTDDLLSIVLEVDQEIRSETQEESLLGVRKAQMKLAALFAARGDETRARRLCNDLAAERPERLERIRRALEGETRAQYWEFTDRGSNFGYLPPERRARLGDVMRWIGEASRRA